MKEALKKVLVTAFEKNAGLRKAYVTSDDNVFSAEHYADDWKKSLTDKDVKVFDRNEVLGITAETVVNTDGGGNDGGNTVIDKDDEKEKLETATKRFIELYDTKPDVNLSLVGIQKAIAAKLAQEKNQNERIAADNNKPIDAVKVEKSSEAKNQNNNSVKDANKPVDPAKAERAALAKEYEELFGKKPTNLLNADKLKAAIVEKKAQ